jgi:hypothetical protein
MANEDRLTPTLLAEWERLAQLGLRGSLLEQAWCRRALALTREIRVLWREREGTSTAAPVRPAESVRPDPARAADRLAPPEGLRPPLRP